MQLELKAGATAAQAVVQTLQQYLHTHPQPAPPMLGQPGAYRLYMAEDDGELDDSCPPLDPTCVVSSTGADCFLLQRRPITAGPSPVPPSSSISDLRGVTAAAVPSGGVGGGGVGGRRISGMELGSSYDDDGPHRRFSSSDSRSHNGYGHGGRAGGGHAHVRKSHRTSSDADDEFAADLHGAGDDPHEQQHASSGRARGDSSINGRTHRGASQQHGSSSRDPSVERPVQNKKKSFIFSFKACVTCSCFATQEESQPIEPHAAATAINSRQR